MIRPELFIADDASLRALVDRLSSVTELAVDTESNGFFAFFEKVCLVQMSTREGDFVVDPQATDLKLLAPLFADPARELVFHAAEGDVVNLRRDYGFTFGRLFDTNAAAKILGKSATGLSGLAKELTGVELSKDEQRSDWGRRPLTPSQIAYAFNDTRHLLAMADALKLELVAKGRLEEAEAEFARLAQKSARPREPDPDAYAGMKVARGLDPRQRAVLKALHAARDALARKLDRPVFKVVSDESLGEIAKSRPKDADALLKVPRLPPAIARRFSRELLAAVAEGEAAPPEVRAAREREAPPPQEVLDRFEKLRAWRKARAAERGVEVQVVAPNAVLMAVARVAPATLEALAQVEGMDAHRLSAWGAQLVAVLAG